MKRTNGKGESGNFPNWIDKDADTGLTPFRNAVTAMRHMPESALLSLETTVEKDLLPLVASPITTGYIPYLPVKTSKLHGARFSAVFISLPALIKSMLQSPVRVRRPPGEKRQRLLRSEKCPAAKRTGLFLRTESPFLHRSGAKRHPQNTGHNLKMRGLSLRRG